MSLHNSLNQFNHRRILAFVLFGHKKAEAGEAWKHFQQRDLMYKVKANFQTYLSHLICEFCLQTKQQQLKKYKYFVKFNASFPHKTVHDPDGMI